MQPAYPALAVGRRAGLADRSSHETGDSPRRDGAGGIGEMQGTMVGEFHVDQPGRGELAKDAAPDRVVEIGPDAESGSVSAPLAYFSVDLPRKTSIGWTYTKALPGAEYGRQGLRAAMVPSQSSGGSMRDIAISAGLGGFSVQKHLTAAARSLAVGEKRGEALGFQALCPSPAPDSPMRACCRPHPGSARSSRLRRVAIAAGAAGLLVIGLDALGRSRWATKRTSGLSMPMPNAMVATITRPHRAGSAAGAARSALGIPAW